MRTIPRIAKHVPRSAPASHAKGRSRTQLLLGLSALAGACALWMPPPASDLRPARMETKSAVGVLASAE
jgi:hypothetical protein